MGAGLKYRIVGRRGVGAFKTGQVVDGDDLAGTNIQALLDGGHIVVETLKPKTELVKEQE